jgi:putative hydrolase of the HAD superfamily
MGRIRVVSFDMEGTLIDSRFSDLIWETDIPELYGWEHGIGLDEARERVLKEYKQVGDERPEWYDAAYWFGRLGLRAELRDLLERRQGDCRVYQEASGVLERLRGNYKLIISSNTMREFLDFQLPKLPAAFDHVFSATSDFGIVKKSEDFYSRVCSVLRVQPDAVAHVGDNQRFDYEAPTKLGVHAFHLDRSGLSRGSDVVRDLVEFEERVRALDRPRP